MIAMQVKQDCPPPVPSLKKQNDLKQKHVCICKNEMSDNSTKNGGNLQL